MNLNLHLVQGIAILDSEGKRIFAKYYTPELSLFEKQTKFESILFSKTNKQNNEIALVEKCVVIYKNNLDCYLYVLGSCDENEIMLSSVLDTIFDSLIEVVKSVDRASLMANFDLLSLIVDEIVDNGIVLETESKDVCAKIIKKSFDFSLGDQTIQNVLHSAKESLTKSFLNGLKSAARS